jgi:hypothetical protein
MIRSSSYYAIGCIVVILNQVGASAQEKAKPVDVTITGQILESDAKDAVRLMPCKVHVLKLAKGKTYLINMVGTDIDSYLRIEDSTGAQVAQDDDSGGGLNARIRFAPAKDDSFKIIATTFSGGEGNYTLTIKDLNAPVVAGNPSPAKPPVQDEPKKAEPKLVQDGVIKLDTPTEMKSIEVRSQLQDGDVLDPVQNHAAKIYAVELAEGTPYVIQHSSDDFDAFLRVRDANGKEVASDDDGGGNLNARIFFVPPAKGIYRIVATSFDGGRGNFQLVVRPATEFGKAVKYDSDKVHDAAVAFFAPGSFTNKDAKDAVKDQSPCQIHQVKLEKGKTYVIDLISGQMDCYLRIEDSKKNNLSEDDDGGEGLNSRLSFSPTEDDVYRLIATNLDGNFGSYLIAVREQK